jgi:hypothetical protein
MTISFPHILRNFRSNPIAICLVPTVSLVFLISCGGGGGGPDPQPVTNNLSASDLVVQTDSPQIGYPMKVSVTLGATEATNNVSVSVFAIDNTDDPEVETRQIPLGSETIAQMAEGSQSYELEVSIPSSVEFPGNYFIAAVIDPAEELAETNEDDNTASVGAILYTGDPNILLAELVLDRAALIINTDSYEEQVTGTVGNVHNADAGGTLTVGANGLEVDETIEIEAFARLRLMRSDKGTSHDVPLYLWYSQAGRYINAFGVDPETETNLGAEEWLPLGEFTPQLVDRVGEDLTVNDVNRDSTHLNFYFPGKLGSELEQAMRYPPEPTLDLDGDFSDSPFPTRPPPDLTDQAIGELKLFLQDLPFSGVRGDESEAMKVMDFAVCLEIRPVSGAIVDAVMEDNERCAPLAIFLPPIESSPPPPETGGFQPQFSTPSNPLTGGDVFGTKGGGAAFSYGLEFGATSTADNRGYIEELRGALPVTIFSTDFDFMSVTVRGQMVPDYAGKPEGEETGYAVEQRFLDALLYVRRYPSGIIPTVSVSFSKEAPPPEEDKVPKQYFIGPVPVVAGGSVAGNFGVEYAFGITEPGTFSFGADPPEYTFKNTVSPFANVEATLFAGVGSNFFSAGVEGVLTLLDERLELSAGTEIEVYDLGDQSGIAEFIIVQGMELTNVFTGPEGKLNLFAKYSVPKIVTCNWGFIKGKCIKSKTIKATKNIWRSGALFTLRDIIDEYENVAFDVVVMDGQDPMYFVEP